MDSGFVAPDFAWWQDRANHLNLKRQGRELVGPCPNCGGTDRFAVKPKDDDGALVNCRQCRDYGAILTAAGWERPTNGTAPPVREFEYRDPEGGHYHSAFRQGDGPDKKCWQRAGFKGRPFPYRIEHLADFGDRPVVVAEGEPKADRLATLGYAAVAWCGGSGAVLRTRWDALAGYDCVLWPDHDSTGQKAMRELAPVLEQQGCAVRWVAVPGGKPKGWDCVDATEADIHRLIEGASSSVPIEADKTDKLFMTMAEFLDMDLSPPEFLIADMLPVGGVGILTAKPDVGKSSALRTLAMAVANGDSWLGRNCKQGPVLLCQFEESPPFARDHLVQMGATEETPIFPFFEPVPDEFMSRLSAGTERHRPALIILDTLGKVAPGRDLLDYTIAQQVLTPLLALARTTRAAIMLSHHNKKGESYDPADDLLGSTAIRANMDHTLAITQTGEKRIAKSVSKRYGELLAPTYLEIDPVTGRVEAAGTVKEKKGEDMEAEIVAVLQDGPLAAADLEGRVTGNAERIRRVRDKLVDRGDIQRKKVGRAHIYCLSVSSHS